MNDLHNKTNLKNLDPIFLTVKRERDTYEGVVDYNMEVSIDSIVRQGSCVISAMCGPFLKTPKEVMIYVGLIHLSSSLKYHASPHPLQTGLSYAVHGLQPCTRHLCAVSGGV